MTKGPSHQKWKKWKIPVLTEYICMKIGSCDQQNIFNERKLVLELLNVVKVKVTMKKF